MGTGLPQTVLVMTRRSEQKGSVVDAKKYTLIRAEDLAPGVRLASGQEVLAVEIGTFRMGDSVSVALTNGTSGVVGRKNRIWVESGSIVLDTPSTLF